MPSLNSAIPRMNRATEHFEALRIMLDAFGDAEAKLIRYEIDGDPPEVVDAIWPNPPLTIDPSAPILAGEVIQSLRTALDYLIYDLAILDSGKPQHGTHFPAESDPKAFDDHNPLTPKRTRVHTCPNPKCRITTNKTIPKTGYLKGLNKTHIAAIEDLQPYRAGKWIGDLIALSNPDKHRDFLPLAKGINIDAKTVYGQPGCFDGMGFPENSIHHAYGDPPVDVRVDVEFAHFVAFEDGRGVLDTLEEFILKTKETIEAFKPGFK
jgi:hypothetical protein